MSHDSFWAEALPYAEQVHAATGVLTSVLLAQCSSETGYGGVDWTTYHNPGNVSSFDGQPVHYFPTLQAGTNAWIQTMLLPYYTAVRHAVGWQAQCLALGKSPWASGHYNDGGGPGSLLVAIIQENNLTQYDGPQPAPPIPPPPHHPPIPEEDMEPFVATDGTTQYIIWSNGTKSTVGTPADGSVLTGPVLGWKYVTLSALTLNAIPNA